MPSGSSLGTALRFPGMTSSWAAKIISFLMMCCYIVGNSSEFVHTNIKEENILEGRSSSTTNNLRGVSDVVGDTEGNEQKRRNLQYAQTAPAVAQQYDPNNPAHVAYAQQQYAQQYAAAAALQAHQAQQYATAGYAYPGQATVATGYGVQAMQPMYQGQQIQSGYGGMSQQQKPPSPQDAKKQYDKIKEQMLATEFGTGDRKVWCFVMKEKYSIIPGQSFGNLPQAMHKQFMHARCDRYFCKPHPMQSKGRFVCEPIDGPPGVSNATASAVPSAPTATASVPAAPVIKT